MDKFKSEAAQGRVRRKCFQEEDQMSSPILPPQGPVATGSIAPSSARRITASAKVQAAAPSEPVSLETFPSAPPPEVLDQMAATAQAYENLHAGGGELRFTYDEQSGRMLIQVRDLGGAPLRAVSASEAIAIAAGGSLE